MARKISNIKELCRIHVNDPSKVYMHTDLHTNEVILTEKVEAEPIDVTSECTPLWVESQRYPGHYYIRLYHNGNQIASLGLSDGLPKFDCTRYAEDGVYSFTTSNRHGYSFKVLLKKR